MTAEPAAESTESRDAAHEPSADGGSPPPPPIVVGATSPGEARRLLALASLAARARGADVILAYVPEPSITTPQAERQDDTADRDLLPQSMSVRVRIVRHRGDADMVFRAVVNEYDAGLLVMQWPGRPQEDEGTAEERSVRRAAAGRIERLFLDPPSEVWLVHGSLGGREVDSVLVVPASERPAAATLTAAAALGGRDGVLTVLEVRPRSAEDEEDDGQAEPSPRLKTRLEEHFAAREHNVRVVTARSLERATLEELDRHAYDLLVMEPPVEGVIPVLAAPAVPEGLMERVGLPVVAVNRPQRRTVVTLRRWVDRLYRWTESLDDEERLAVYSDLRRASRPDRDFITLTALSTGIAALGLLLNSVAVIIGAMLVAPFMAPLIALGLAIVHGDVRFMRISVLAILRGTVVAYPVGVALGLAVPQAALGAEVLSRTEPSGLDLLVALLSGAAGAYAYARRDLSAALPGVAIAAALVPPLAASAIALGSGEYEAAAGAALLYVLNVTTISAAAAVIFLWFGFRPEAQRLGRGRVFARGFAFIVTLIAVVVVAVVALGAQERTLAHIETRAAGVAEEWLPADAEVTALSAHSEGDAVRIRLDVESPADPDPPALLAERLAEVLDRPVSVELRLIPIIEAAASPDGAPADAATDAAESTPSP